MQLRLYGVLLIASNALVALGSGSSSLVLAQTAGEIQAPTGEPPPSQSKEKEEEKEKPQEPPPPGGQESEEKPLRYGSLETFIEIHGFVDLEYTDAQRDGARNGVSTFDNHHVNVFLNGQLRENLLIDIELEYEHAGEQIEVDRAEISWAIAKFLQLEVGRFYQPFGIERNVWYGPKNRLVTRPLVMQQVIPGNFYADGIGVNGKLGKNGILGYEVALTNGLGRDAATNRRGSRQTSDNNSSRAVGGRLALSPRKKLEFGTSYHTGKYDDDARLRISFWGADAAWNAKGLELRGEYVQVSVESAGGDFDQSGFYVQAAYEWLLKKKNLRDVTLVVRYDYLDLDHRVEDRGDTEAFSLGLSVSPFERLRMKSEYQWIGERAAPSRANNVVLLQWVVDF